MLLLDEPFGALDAQVRAERRGWLRRLHDEIPLTTVFVTHDQDEAFEVADRIVVMNHGRIEQIGTPAEVFAEIGPPAVPALKPLLDDTTRRSSYVGSEEATEMAMKRYRVKDFAAFYIARILKLPLPWEPKLENRDAAIEQLRKQLPSGT